MSSTLDALATSNEVTRTYRRYLLSTFRPRQRALASDLEAELRRSPIAKGPYLQATPAFEHGAFLTDLIDEGLLSPDLRRLPPSVFARPLYRHQEEAIRKAVAGRNLVVATGTGSGKTESFLLPILNGLLREKERGTLGQPGVRALLLYPMNALANDQIKRLRVLLADLPEITFGRYIGETWRTQQQADREFHLHYPGQPRLGNELLSREVMQNGPPHLLLTNYAMLEYLLLRPSDSALFDGDTGRHWRHIVLDEAHVYNGAQGAEVSMLLRRVRDRVTVSRPGAIQAFATSATLGSGRADYPKLLDFAQTLTGETFEWRDEDPGRQDVVEAYRSVLTQGERRYQLSDQAVRELQHAYRGGARPESLASIVAADGIDLGLDGPGITGSSEDWLYELLRHDERVLTLQRSLQGSARLLTDLSADLFDDPRDLVSLVDLCVAARPAPDDGPLLPARYHHFLRALEVAQICLHPDHDSREPRLHLSRSVVCPSCNRRGIKAGMFELGVCRTCRSEFVVGLFNLSGGVIKAASEDAQPRYLLIDPLAGNDDEDDELALTNSSSYQLATGRLCTQCMTYSPDGTCRCETPRPVDVTLVDPGDGERLHRCPVCNTRVDGDIVTRFVSGADAPASVVATAIYQKLPASSDANEALYIGQGRRLLTFSDSRQDAAFFAPFLARTYARGVQRRLLFSALRTDELYAMDDLEGPIRRSASDALVIDPETTSVGQLTEVRSWLAEEVLAFDRRISLEGSGLAEISVAVPREHRTPRFLSDAGFSDDEALALIQLLLLTVRLQGAVEMPDGVDVRHERFAPRNRQMGLRRESPAPSVISWLPGKGTNRRLDVLTRIKEERNASFDCERLLHDLWEYLTANESPWQRSWVNSSNKSAGFLHRLAWDRLRVEQLHDGHRPGRCNRCNQLWWRTVSGVCPGWRCPGRVTTIENIDEISADHYAALYRELEPTALSASEHTAQWRSEKGSALQQDFTNGRLNVLSCSTTFELGVDVGDVQAVLLKNVPPSPANYVQRAGRAGRRSDSAALVITFAQRRSHDLTYFNHPDRMVNGVVEPPLIQLENPSIVRRHVHSMAFAQFERITANDGKLPHEDVESFFLVPSEADQQLGLPPAYQQFANWLGGRPGTLLDALQRVVPEALQAELGVGSWAWVQALTTQSDDEPTFGWLHRAAAEVIEDLRLLDEDYQAAHDAHENKKAEVIRAMRRNVAGQKLINYLSQKNVLPKYGFPVDVVELDVAGAGTDVAANLELSRDLKVALSEYSPGRQIVAGGMLWESRGLKRRQGLEWVSYRWVVCGDCGAFRHRIGETVEERCPRCDSIDRKRGHAGTFVIPSFGFVGKYAGPSGQTRPPRTSTVETYFGAYKDSEPDFEPYHIGDGAGTLQIRTSRQGRIAVVNRGPRGEGFSICGWCGASEARGDQSGGRKTAKKAHERLGRPGQDCTGPMKLLSLGHEFLTDTLEIVIESSQIREVLLSTLYAMIEGAADLGIPRDDLDGALNPIGHNRHSLVLYDAVPGGAGHAQRIAVDLERVLRAAYNRVDSCPDCAPETSCYSCLRSYSNQRFHDDLRRRDAADLLAVLLGKQSDDELIGLDLADPEVHELLRAVHAAGAPLPIIGHELPNRSGAVVELAWVGPKIGITVGEDVDRDQYLEKHGWVFGPARAFTVEDLLRRLRP